MAGPIWQTDLLYIVQRGKQYLVVMEGPTRSHPSVVLYKTTRRARAITVGENLSREPLKAVALYTRRANPHARYRSEKGPPVQKDSRWLDTKTSADLSNTYWPSGYVDYSRAEPSVWTDEPQITAAEWKAYARGGKRHVTYLLHPDKWRYVSGNWKAARDFIPNVSVAPSQPIGYALRIEYLVPLKLSSRPELPQNPRAWFDSYGQATACRQIGEVLIVATGKVKPLYERIIVHSPGMGPRGPGCVLLKGKK